MAEPTLFVSAPLPNAVSTDVEQDSARGDAKREAWQRLIDYQLIEWGSDPSRFDEEDVAPPSRKTINRAITIARQFGEAGFPPPTRTVPDPCGGIVFEREADNVLETIRVCDDGTTEYCLFRNSQLLERKRW